MDRVPTSSSSAFAASYPFSLSFHAITPIAAFSGSANTFIVINDSMRSNHHKGNKSKSSFFSYIESNTRDITRCSCGDTLVVTQGMNPVACPSISVLSRCKWEQFCLHQKWLWP